jgi:hypothetical protein
VQQALSLIKWVDNVRAFIRAGRRARGVPEEQEGDVL